MPVIGCYCNVCQSKNPHDKRLRSSALVSIGDANILIDAGPDFRQQMLKAKINHLDAIFLTHEHNDHVIGLDDVRPFNFRSGQPIRVFALPRVATEVRKRFEYVFGEYIPGLPQIELIEIGKDDEIKIGSTMVRCIGAQHGRLPILGFRFENLTYLTDVKTIEPDEMKKIYGTKTLIVNALHHAPHPTHMNLEECLKFVSALKPDRTWLTHISHHMGLAKEVSKNLPPGIRLAHDNLEIEF